LAKENLRGQVDSPQDCQSNFRSLKLLITNLGVSCSVAGLFQGRRGRYLFRASNPPTQPKPSADFKIFFLAIIPFQRRSRIIVINRIFATTFYLIRWSIMNECKSDPIYNSLLSDRECKQLSCEKIDDHTANDLKCSDRTVLEKVVRAYLINSEENCIS
jgi:hypothetical protein